MRHERRLPSVDSDNIAEPDDPEVVEFSRRHGITRAVAKAILAHAKTPEDADKAVAKMRGE